MCDSLCDSLCVSRNLNCAIKLDIVPHGSANLTFFETIEGTVNLDAPAPSTVGNGAESPPTAAMDSIVGIASAAMAEFFQEADRNLSAMPSDDDGASDFPAHDTVPWATTPSGASVKRKADPTTRGGNEKCARIFTYPARPGVAAPAGAKCGDCLYGRKSQPDLLWDPCRALPGRGIGEPLIERNRGSVEFDNRTGPGAQFKLRYDALHDEEAAAFLELHRVRTILRRHDLISKDCLVKMSLRDYNQWQRERTRLQLESFNAMRKRKDLECRLADLMGEL